MAVLTLTLLACVVICANGYRVAQPDIVNYSYTRTEGGEDLTETATSVVSGSRIWFASIDGDLANEGLTEAKSIIDYSTADDKAVVRVGGVCFVYTCDNPAFFDDAVTVLETRDTTTVAGLPTVCKLDATGPTDQLNLYQKADLLQANPALTKLCSVYSKIFMPSDQTTNAAFPAKGAEGSDETFLEVLTLNNKIEILAKESIFYRYHPRYPAHHNVPRYPSFRFHG